MIRYHFLLLGELESNFNESTQNCKVIQKFYNDYEDHFPLLKKVVDSLLAVMPTTSIIERQFSTLGNILTRKRNRLAEDKVLRILQVRKYQEFEAEIRKIQNS